MDACACGMHARITRTAALTTAALSALLLLLLLAAGPERGASLLRGGAVALATEQRVDHVTLAGGRIFACDAHTHAACLEAALAASADGRVASCGAASDRVTCLTDALAAANAEAAALHAREGKRACEASSAREPVSETGAFCVSATVPEVGGNAFLDKGVAAGLCAAAGAGASVLDLGAGVGHYAAPYAACNLTWRGYDGAANIEEATRGTVAWADLSVPIDVGAADWVQSLEVGEHLPAAFAGTYLDNLVRHARRGILLSWAVPEQGGNGHVNNRPNKDVIADLAARGFTLDAERTRALRASAELRWLKQTTMLFVRKPTGRAG